MFQRSIDGNDSFRAASEKHLAIFFDQIFAVPMVCGEIEVARFHQMIANPAHDLCVVTVAQFGDQNTDGIRAPTAEGPSQKAWAIVELLSGRFDAVAGRLWNGTPGNVVENDGNRRRIETQILCELLQPAWFL